MNAIAQKESPTRQDILSLENALSKIDGAVSGDSALCPLKHSFAAGVYVREIFIPKGTVLTGKIHRHSHPNFLMKGEVIVVTENGGREHLKAPLAMVSVAGTKRAVIALEDTIWITVHVTNETDLEKIEEHVIAKSYDDLLPTGEKQMIESELSTKNCLILALKGKGRDYSCLLGLASVGLLLPFKAAIEAMRSAGVSAEGLFVTKQANGIYHVDTIGELSLAGFYPEEGTLVGSWVAVGVSGATLVGSYFGNKGKKTSATQVPLETEQQRDARRGLLEFGQTGKYGGYTAGTPYTGSLGEFGVTALEEAGQGAIGQRLGGQDFGSMGLRDLVTTEKYNPLNQEGLYAGLSGVIDRTTRDASDAFKRSASFGGRLYSTDTVRNLGEINARGAENKAATLAGLYDNYIGRKVGGMTSAIGAQDSAIGDAFTYGGLPRTLSTAKDQAAYSEFQRQRAEQQQQLTALSSVAGANSNFGVPTVELPTDNPWGDIAGLLAQFGGNYLGNRAANKPPSSGRNVASLPNDNWSAALPYGNA